MSFIPKFITNYFYPPTPTKSVDESSEDVEGRIKLFQHEKLFEFGRLSVGGWWDKSEFEPWISSNLKFRTTYIGKALDKGSFFPVAMVNADIFGNDRFGFPKGFVNSNSEHRVKQPGGGWELDPSYFEKALSIIGTVGKYFCPFGSTKNETSEIKKDLQEDNFVLCFGMAAYKDRKADVIITNTRNQEDCERLADVFAHSKNYL